jgi:recombination protein RecA
MSSQRRHKLDAVVARLQLDYGPRAIRRAARDEKMPFVARIPTTFSELDAVLDGGLPQGRITEISGPATSGKLTLVSKAIASAQHLDRQTLAAWIDPSCTCDGDYLHRCGIDLQRLLVVHPATLADAFVALLHLAESNTLALLAVDGPPAGVAAPRLSPADDAAFAATLARLTTILTGTATAIVFLTEPQHPLPALAHAAALRIVLQHEQWITRNGDIRGYVGRAEIVKNRLGAAGARVPVRIVFNGTVRGDGL